MTRLRMESGTNEPRRAFRFGALDLVCPSILVLCSTFGTQGTVLLASHRTYTDQKCPLLGHGP
jgi:hypothetical protein